ncbi:muconolactone Delta-isomerase [Pantoea sp. Ap-967]|uniref:muconolactone Delta-isomerase n=1 Tax=Pantoea sp. Ap-967 TaxID=2608362 RepID=UPI00141ECA6B|nr:muconolactone Delta-isomerase [Pantoea sp. Ap-967]NIE78029.1 muconolactone Delta-isomerase [Pantoea sp. Ap-967]
MLFHVRMSVNIPHDVPEHFASQLKVDEKEVAQKLQQEGVWRHLWRVAGLYSNVSVFDVPDAQVLHEILIGLPLFPYMDIEVTALCRHPSSIHADDK